jgi:hypothetical protein
MESETFDLVAASLRADAVDLKAYLEALATKLTQSFPGRVQVERRGRLRGAKAVRKLVVSLGDDRFTIDNDGAGLICLRSSMVRGIALKNDQLELGAWINELSRAVVSQAEASEQGRVALEQLLL